jgi:hypothetical protein
MSGAADAELAGPRTGAQAPAVTTKGDHGVWSVTVFSGCVAFSWLAV